MPHLSRCAACDRPVRIPDNLLGQPVKCPSCGSVFSAELAPTAPERSSYQEPREHKAPPPRRPEGEWDDDYAPRPRRRHRDVEPHRGTAILILGILSLVFMGLIGAILGPMAWLMGNGDLNKIRAGRMDRDGESSTNAGRICGIIGTIGSIFVCFCVAGIVVIALSEEMENNFNNNNGGPPPAPQLNPPPRRRFEAPAPLRMQIGVAPIQLIPLTTVQ